MTKEKIEKFEEIVIPLKPKPITQISTEEPIKKSNFAVARKKPEELIRLFYTDKDNKPIVYPVDSFESDTGWVECVCGKEDSDFRRTIVFKTDTNKKQIDKTIDFIKNDCNPGTDKEHAGWLVYGDDDNPMVFNIKTSKR